MLFDQERAPREAAWRAHEASLAPPRTLGHIVDATMFFGLRSGGIKRYLLAKRDWMETHRPEIRHTLMVPGRIDRRVGENVLEIASPPLPFSNGYRWPMGLKKWTDTIVDARPDLIEAGDAFLPGRAAVDAADRCGAALVGFCHTDPAALAGLHFGEWASAPARLRWAAFYSRFDLVIAPSRFIAARLADAGVRRISVQPLGVDTSLFHPQLADKAAVRTELGVAPDERLLVFAGRAAREKNVALLVEALDLLDPRYRLLLIGAGPKAPPHPRIINLDFETSPRNLARRLASCDAFVHANDQEPFGLVVLEALASGLPVVGPSTGGISEIIDETVGQRAAEQTPRAYAEAIEALFGRDLGEVSVAARTRAETQYGWDRVFPSLLDHYGQVVSGDVSKVC